MPIPRYGQIGEDRWAECLIQAPWQRLYFLPDPHQHGSLRPILGPALAGCRGAVPALLLAVATAAEPAATPAATSGLLSSICRGRGATGSRATVTRKMVWVTSWRMVAFSSSNIW